MVKRTRYRSGRRFPDPKVVDDGSTRLYLSDLIDALDTLDKDLTNLQEGIENDNGSGVSAFVSLSDVSAATSVGANGYAVVWSDSSQQFVLAQVSGVGDIVSVDNRVTSVQAGVVSVDGRVTSVRTEMINRVSVEAARITSIQFVINSVNAVISVQNTNINQVSSSLVSLSNQVSNQVTSLQNQINLVSNQVSVVNQRVTDVSANVTSVNTNLSNQINLVSSRVTSIQATIPTNLVSLVDTSLAVGTSTDGYSVVWSNTQAKFILSSISGGGGSFGNLDGGYPETIYGGTTPIDCGGP